LIWLARYPQLFRLVVAASISHPQHLAARAVDLADAGFEVADVVAHLFDPFGVAFPLVCFTQRKTGAEVTIPLHPSLVSYFTERFAARENPDEAGLIFPDLAKRYTGGKGGLSLEFTNLMELAKVPRKAELAGRKGVRSFHSLRHTAASLMANAGVPEELRMRITGHESKDVHCHYTHLELEALRKAVSAMPDFDESAEGS